MTKKRIRHVKFTRKFGGKKFDYKDGSFVKYHAKTMAEKYRKRGYNARVVKAPKTMWSHGWAVYARKRR